MAGGPDQMFAAPRDTPDSKDGAVPPTATLGSVGVGSGVDAEDRGRAFGLDVQVVGLLTQATMCQRSYDTRTLPAEVA